MISTIFQVSGFGYLMYQGKQAKELRDVNVQIHSAEMCQQMYKGITSVFNPEYMLCAGGHDKDACQVRSQGTHSAAGRHEMKKNSQGF